MEVYLQVEHLTKSFGDLVLFTDITFSIHKNEKVAIIAKNGAGKSTLLSIISNLDTPDSGNISFRNNIKIAFLDQNPQLPIESSVFDAVYLSSDDKTKIIKDYENAINTENHNLITELSHKIDNLNLWDFETNIKQLLSKLKITDLSQKIKHLSGGQKKRVALAITLLKEPDLLILDEPTNHLDLDMIEWLELYLKKTKSTLLMVTHDRYFLDRVCNNIIEIDDFGLFKYNGNYEYYLTKREERLLNKQSEIDKAKNLFSKELEWIRRMPKARSTKAKYRIDAFYDLKDVANQRIANQQIEANVLSKRLGNKIVNFKNVYKSFDKLTILNNFTYDFQKGEKVCIVGNNGTGKSTFLNLLTGNINPDKGEIEIGSTIEFGYYKQDGIKINDNERVIDVVTNIAEFIEMDKGKSLSASAFLNKFLFPPEKQYNLVSKLSGGEKRRLYLLTVLIKNPNFLILDEPTNDLDIMTLNVLEDFLKSYQGVVIIVSHDRYFNDKIADRLFVFSGNGEVKGFEGNYTQYRNYKEQTDEEALNVTTKEIKTLPVEKIAKSKKMGFNEKREYETLEKEIEELNKQKLKIEEFLNSGSSNHNLLEENAKEIAEIIAKIDNKELRWLELSELL